MSNRAARKPPVDGRVVLKIFRDANYRRLLASVVRRRGETFVTHGEDVVDRLGDGPVVVWVGTWEYRLDPAKLLAAVPSPPKGPGASVVVGQVTVDGSPAAPPAGRSGSLD